MSSKKQFGYIEGYFGRTLSWQERFRIIDHLKTLSMNTYIYAPKEDPYHRIEWRTHYPAKEKSEISAFIKYGKKSGVNVVTAIGPGLSYDYISEQDYASLLNKIKSFVRMGSTTVALLMDDIPNELPNKYQTQFTSLGDAHGKLLKRLTRDLKRNSKFSNLIFCPTIYTDQYNPGKAVDTDYIKDLAKSIPAKVTILWTGEKIVSETITMKNCGNILKLFKNNVIIWDNYYANDYAPLRLFVGSYKGRSTAVIDNSKGILINPTGLFNTDKFLLSLFSSFLKTKSTSIDKWEKVAREFGISELFFPIKKFFWSPYESPKSSTITKSFLEQQDHLYDDLIVKWINPLKLEWFPYLHTFWLDTTYLLKKDSVKKRGWASIHFPPTLLKIFDKKNGK